MIRAAIAVVCTTLTVGSAATAVAATPYDAMIAQHAAANGVPVELVHRVIVRESRYRPGVVSKGNYGMMQIKPATARGLGYTGSPQGLLDANTNLTYAVKYLAGAYRAAHGNHNLAVRYYAGGYYYAAKAQGWNANAQRVATSAVIPVVATEVAPVAAAKPEIVSDATHQKMDGNPLLFTIKPEPAGSKSKNASAAPFAPLTPNADTNKKSRRSQRQAQNNVVNPFAGLLGSATQKPERASRTARSTNQ